MQFITPALVAGALLFAVPLLIHIFNRQRFRRRDWAAMEYLLRAYQKHRRRLRIENLILLLLRCLLPVVLALAIARPFFRDSPGMLPSVGTTHHVMVFDRSYSMGYQPSGSQSPHHRALRIATNRLEQLEGQAGQRITLVLAGVRPEFPVRGSVSLATARARLARLGPPPDSAESMLPALTQVAAMLEEERAKPGPVIAGQTRLYIFTDLQKSCFGDTLQPAGKPTARDGEQPAGPAARPTEKQPTKQTKGAGTDPLADTAREVMARLAKLASVSLIDVGGSAGTTLENVQLTKLRMSRAHAVTGVALEADVTVRNLSTSKQLVEVTLEKDSGEPVRKVVQVEAGAETEIPFPVVFRQTGLRQLKASIPTDGLEADNAVYHVVDVKEQLKVLLVEGSPETEWRLMDTGWLRVVLDPTQGRGDATVTEFATKVIDSTEFLARQEKPQGYDMVVLAGVERLNEQVADDLVAAVEAGTGLLVMLGPRCDPDSYNTHLYRNGEGPLGIALRRHEGFDPGGQRYYRSQVVDLEHPVFHDFKEDESLLQYLQLAGIYRYFTTDRETLAKNHAVLWQISNPSLSPLLVGGRFGEGRTLLLTSAITAQPKKWNTLDAQIHSIPLFHPLAHWLSHPATDPYNVLVGGSLSAVVPKRPQGMAVVLCDRAGSSKVPVAQDAKPLRGNLFALPPFTQTNFAGFYTFEMEQGESGTAQQLRLPFAVNPDPTEGELGYLAHAVVRERLGIQRIHTALPDDSAPIETAGIGEIGPFLLYLVLLLVVGEACWARFVSRRRT